MNKEIRISFKEIKKRFNTIGDLREFYKKHNVKPLYQDILKTVRGCKK